MKAAQKRSFVPALGLDLLTPLYDPLLRLTRVDATKQRLIDQARIEPGMSVLDFGCGTGTLALLVKRAQPTARVTGLDVDSKVLSIAERKIAAAGVDIHLHLGKIEDADFDPASFDRVLTTLMFHHLTTEEKLSALRTARRLLRPGGSFHIADLGGPRSDRLRRVVAASLRRFGASRLEANLSGGIPVLMREAGYVAAAETARAITPFGRLVYWSATAPLAHSS